METGRKKVRLGELLVNSGVITNDQLQQALDNPKRQGKKLGEFLVDEGVVMWTRKCWNWCRSMS